MVPRRGKEVGFTSRGGGGATCKSPQQELVARLLHYLAGFEWVEEGAMEVLECAVRDLSDITSGSL